MDRAAAKIKINSYIDSLDTNGLAEGTPEVTEADLSGFVEEGADVIAISCSEKNEGGEVSSTVEISSGEVTVKRRGAIESVMFFSKEIPYKTVYNLPPYSFDMEIVTKKIEISEREGTLSLLLIYKMTVGGADRLCRMSIEAKF